MINPGRAAEGMARQSDTRTCGVNSAVGRQKELKKNQKITSSKKPCPLQALQSSRVNVLGSEVR